MYGTTPSSSLRLFQELKMSAREVPAAGRGLGGTSAGRLPTLATTCIACAFVRKSIYAAAMSGFLDFETMANGSATPPRATFGALAVLPGKRKKPRFLPIAFC